MTDTTGSGSSVTGVLEELSTLIGQAQGQVSGGGANGTDGTGNSGGSGNPDDPLETAEDILRLKGCVSRLSRKHAFKAGDLVQWKKGLKNKRTPEYGAPIVVTQVLDAPLLDTGANDAGSPYFREPLDLVAGELDGDGDFLCFYYDSRRFEPYQG